VTWIGAGLLLLVAFTGLGVVRTRDVTSQVIALSFYGVLMALVFFFFQMWRSRRSPWVRSRCRSWSCWRFRG